MLLSTLMAVFPYLQKLVAVASQRVHVGLAAHDALTRWTQILPPELAHHRFLGGRAFDRRLVFGYTEGLRRGVANGVVLANLVERAFQVLNEARGGKFLTAARAFLLCRVLARAPVKFNSHRRRALNQVEELAEGQ